MAGRPSIWQMLLVLLGASLLKRYGRTILTYIGAFLVILLCTLEQSCSQ